MKTVSLITATIGLPVLLFMAGDIVQAQQANRSSVPVIASSDDQVSVNTDLVVTWAQR
jgi:hypothetical protein